MATIGEATVPRKKAEGDYRHGDLRNALLDAAAELVRQRSGPDFSLREIAAEVGVRHAAIYRHFPSKEALLASLATRAFQRMSARFSAIEQQCGADIAARIDGLGEAYLSMARDEPGAYRVMFALPEAPGGECDAAAAACFDALVRAFADGQSEGYVRGDLPAIAIGAGNWAALHGLAMLLLDRRLGENGPAGGSEALLPALREIQRAGWRAR